MENCAFHRSLQALTCKWKQNMVSEMKSVEYLTLLTGPALDSPVAYCCLTRCLGWRDVAAQGEECIHLSRSGQIFSEDINTLIIGAVFIQNTNKIFPGVLTVTTLSLREQVRYLKMKMVILDPAGRLGNVKARKAGLCRQLGSAWIVSHLLPDGGQAVNLRAVVSPL